METREKQGGGKTGSVSPRTGQGRLFGETPQGLPLIVQSVIERHWAGNTKAAAAALGVADKTLANYLTPAADRALPLAILLKLIDLTGDAEVLDYLCSLAGGVFVRLPETTAAHPSMLAVQRFQADASAAAGSLAQLPDGDREEARLRCQIVQREISAFIEGLRG